MAVVIVRHKRVPLSTLPVSFNGGPNPSGRDGAEYKRIGAERIALRRTLEKIDGVPRLTPEEEAAAIAQFKRTKGISKYPEAFCAPSQACRG